VKGLGEVPGLDDVDGGADGVEAAFSGCLVDSVEEGSDGGLSREGDAGVAGAVYAGAKVAGIHR
jgi:hypothetical protein